MITDCLAPVVADKGVATFVTCDGMRLLSEGLTFHTARVESYYYNASIYQLSVKPTIGAIVGGKKFYVDQDTYFMLPDGWRNIDSLTDAKSQHLIKAYYTKCTICGALYWPHRPFRSFCSTNCMRSASKFNITAIQPFDESNTSILYEDWLKVESIRCITNSAMTKMVRFSDIENTVGAYVNGVLMSCKALQTAV